MTTSESTPTPVQYTAFWPLIIILSTVLVISGFELVNLLGQRQQLRAAAVQIEKQVKQSQVVSGTLAKMSKELLLLAGSSEEARKIVKDFGIQVRKPESSAAPATKK